MRGLLEKVLQVIQEPLFFSDLLVGFMLLCLIAITVLCVVILARMAFA